MQGQKAYRAQWVASLGRGICLVAWSIGIGFAAATAHAGSGGQHVDAGQVPAGISAAEWTQIESQLVTDQYLIAADGESASGRNPAHGLDLHFADGGLTVRTDTGDWTLGLKTTGYGRADSVEPLATRSPAVIGGTQVEYRHKALTEWYRNRKDGLEHGYTVATRPDGHGPVNLRIALTGRLKAERLDGDAIVLVDGEHRLRYHKLEVVDARGQVLPATMTLASTDTLVLGYDDRHARYPVTVDPLLINEQQKVVPANEDYILSGQRFGTSLASDGNTLIVNEIGYLSFFDRTATGWTRNARIRAPRGVQQDSPIAVSGLVAVVGAPSGGSIDDLDGRVHFYLKLGDAWLYQGFFKAPDREITGPNGFGKSLALSGNHIIVGAQDEDRGQGGDRVVDVGSIYFFERNFQTWTQTAKFNEPKPARDGFYGRHVAIFGDIAVASSTTSSGASGESGNGSAYVYQRGAAGWQLQREIVADEDVLGMRFGVGVAVSESAIAVTSLETPNAEGDRQPALYIFDRTGVSREAKLFAADLAPGGSLFTRVSASGDSVLAAGRRNGQETVAFVVRRLNLADGWMPQAILRPANPEASVGTIVLANDRAILGSSLEQSESGATYAFDRSPERVWTERQRLAPDPSPVNLRLGRRVALADGAALISRRGGADLFEQVAGVWTRKQFLPCPSESGVPALLDLALGNDTAALGCSLDDAYAVIYQKRGSAYTLTADLGALSPIDELKDEPFVSPTNFGSSLAIDGDRMIVGVPVPDFGLFQTTILPPSALIYVKRDGDWLYEATLQPSDRLSPSDQTGGASVFGRSVALEGDTAVIGDYDSAWVFQRVGDQWIEAARLSDPEQEAAGSFGREVEIADRSIFVGGTDNSESMFREGEGVVHVFERALTGWRMTQSLRSAEPAAGDGFGRHLSVSSGQAVVSAPREDAFYFYQRGVAGWQQRARVPITGNDPAPSSGNDVALLGNVILVGTPENDEIAVRAGAARIFRVEQNLDFGDAPAPYPTLLANDGARHEAGGPRFGERVDYEADATVEGKASGDDETGEDDEDGVSFANFTVGGSGTVSFELSGRGSVSVWIDYDQNGVWSEEERVLAGQVREPGLHVVPIEVPEAAVSGPTYARARVSSIALTEPTGLAPNGEVEDHVVTIALPSLSIGDARADEGNPGSGETLEYEVRLSAATRNPVTVNWAPGNRSSASLPSDVQLPANRVITFAPGETVRSLQIPIVGDTTPEFDETLLILLSSPVNATIATGIGTGTIVNDDLAVVGFAEPTSSFGEDDGSAAIRVTLAEASPVSVSVAYRVSGGTAGMADADLMAGTLDFEAGTTEQNIVVALFDDSLPEEPKTLEFALDMPVQATVDLLRSGHTLTIVDDDPINDVAIVAMPSSTKEEAKKGRNPEPAMASFVVSRTGDTGTPLTVRYRTADGSASGGTDYVAANGLLTWAPGDASSRTVTVMILDDGVAEAAETFSMQLTDSNGNSAGSPSSAVVTIQASDCRGNGCPR